jgi:ATP-dependent RNA helicase RhlE
MPSGGGSFADLGLVPQLLAAVKAQGYQTPTPIQVAAIPHVLAGRDLLGCARTGTGKTAGFALPMLQLLAAGGRRAAPRTVRALVIVPTRELATQVADSFRAYGAGLEMKVAVIFGGVSQGAQVTNLARGLDVLVATPGRLVDLMGQKHARLDAVEILVLDEADHMLDLGFLPDVRRILGALPKKRQTLFFSATMPPAIGELADTILASPEKVFVTPAATTVEAVEQSVHFVERSRKPELLREVLSAPGVKRALVFTRTKRGSDKVAKRLTLDGIPAQAIHGNKSQGNRERTLESFRVGRTRVLVATDIAARGIDVDGITHVVNYELPNVPETYVHRIGRTARAGATGVAIAFCDAEERPLLRDIERLIKRSVPVASGSAAGLRAEPPEERERRAARGGARAARSASGGGGSRGGRGGKPQRSGGYGRGTGGGPGARDRSTGRAPVARDRSAGPARLPAVKRGGTPADARGSGRAEPSSSFGVGV